MIAYLDNRHHPNINGLTSLNQNVQQIGVQVEPIGTSVQRHVRDKLFRVFLILGFVLHFVVFVVAIGWSDKRA